MSLYKIKSRIFLRQTELTLWQPTWNYQPECKQWRTVTGTLSFPGLLWRLVERYPFKRGTSMKSNDFWNILPFSKIYIMFIAFRKTVDLYARPHIPCCIFLPSDSTRSKNLWFKILDCIIKAPRHILYSPLKNFCPMFQTFLLWPSYKTVGASLRYYSSPWRIGHGGRYLWNGRSVHLPLLKFFWNSQ